MHYLHCIDMMRTYKIEISYYFPSVLCGSSIMFMFLLWKLILSFHLQTEHRTSTKHHQLFNSVATFASFFYSSSTCIRWLKFTDISKSIYPLLNPTTQLCMPTQHHIQWIPGGLSLEVKWLGHEAIPPLLQYTFMVWCSVKKAQGIFTFVSLWKMWWNCMKHLFRHVNHNWLWGLICTLLFYIESWKPTLSGLSLQSLKLVIKFIHWFSLLKSYAA